MRPLLVGLLAASVILGACTGAGSDTTTTSEPPAANESTGGLAVDVENSSVTVANADLTIDEVVCMLQPEEVAKDVTLLSQVSLVAHDESATYPVTLFVTATPEGENQDLFVEVIPSGAIESRTYEHRAVAPAEPFIVREGDVFTAATDLAPLPPGTEAESLAVSLSLDCSGAAASE